MNKLIKNHIKLYNQAFLYSLVFSLLVISNFFKNQKVFAGERGIIPIPKPDLTQIAKGVTLKEIYKESYALVIGAHDYNSDWPDLPGVENDVEEIKTVLIKQGFSVTLITNPTKRELDVAFDSFINRYGLSQENRILIYFAGHGHTQKLSYGGKMGYLVPINSPNPEKDLNGFLANSVDMQQIEVYAKRIQARHALFLFDSCFSGSFFSISRGIPKSIQYKVALPVRQFITSGSAGEKVSDDSIFRNMFVEALNGKGDLNLDGFLTGAELGEFLKNKVIDYTKGSQHPQYGTIRDPNLDKGDFVFSMKTTDIKFSAIKPLKSSLENQIQDKKIYKRKKELADLKRQILIEGKKLELLREKNTKKKIFSDKKMTERIIESGKAQKIGTWIVFKNSTAVDIRTGLMWMTEDFYNLKGRFPRNQEEIMAWVNEINFAQQGGFADWRVPKIWEYQSIYNKRLARKGFSYIKKRGVFSENMRAKPVGYPIVFKNGGGYSYWSSNFLKSKNCGVSNETESICVKIFNFRNGQTTAHDSNRGDFFSSSVRLVRDLQ